MLLYYPTKFLTNYSNLLSIPLIIDALTNYKFDLDVFLRLNLRPSGIAIKLLKILTGDFVLKSLWSWIEKCI